METIDFIIPWVDGNDPVWLATKNKYEGKDSNSSLAVDANSDCRYRDNGLLRYWFRGVEAFAPWVNKVFFITNGQKPSWLNLNHPQLRWVKHSDFIPERFLPTFNSITIEMNFHRISCLSERFVYFNDDIFLLRKVSPTFFFKEGFPILDCDLRYTKVVGYNNWSRHLFNDYCLVNKSFNIFESIWQNRKKWFSIKELGYKKARKNVLCYLANKTLPVSTYGHVALPHLKSTLQELWERYPEIMHQASMHKFRADDQVNQYLLCAWNQAKGQFYPTLAENQGMQMELCPLSFPTISRTVINQTTPQICVNDSPLNTESEKCLQELARSFDYILPNKSSYEK